MRTFLLASMGLVAVQAANPIRKVVTLLQDMKNEIEAEGDKEQDLYKKFMCFCSGNTDGLSKAAADAAAKIEELKAKKSADEAEKAQLVEDLKRHKSDRSQAKADLGTATKLREKEHNEYLEASGDTKSHIDALNVAIPAIEKGMGSFLQTSGAKTLKNLISSLGDNMSTSNEDKDAVVAFLEQKGDYIPASGQIVGILKNMKDEFDKSLGGIVSDEENAVKAFADLKAAKQKEIAAASSAVESKTERAGKLAVAIVQAKAGIDNATAELSEAEKFKAELSVTCKEKTADWEERSSTRAEEIKAIGEAIQVLNDDDALDIFNQTLPKPRTPASFLQTRHEKSTLASKAKAMVSAIKTENPAVSLLQHTIMSSLKAKKVDFSKVLKMIDDMVALLNKEQSDDESHRDWCNTEFDTSDDEKKAAEAKAAGLESTISDVRDGIAALKDEIAELQAKIAALDKTVAEAGAQRENEHADFVASSQLSKAATQLIFKAKNRLQKFYNPQLYVAPKERQLTREEQILTGAGQDVQILDQPELIHGTTQTVFIQLHNNAEVPKPEAPESYGAFKKKSGKNNSVTALLDLLTKELEKDQQEAEHAEKTARKEYEELVQDAQETRQQDTKSVATSEASKAELEGQLDEAKNGLAMTNDQLAQVKNYIAELHGSCDFIIASFEERRQARTNEVEGLKNAKAVLSGASYN